MNQTRKLTLSAILVSVMLVLGYLESLVPISSVPGIKLGLSNCVLLIAVYWLGVRISFEIMVVKVVLLGLMMGNPMMIVYSLAGGTLSLALYGVPGQTFRYYVHTAAPCKVQADAPVTVQRTGDVYCVAVHFEQAEVNLILVQHQYTEGFAEAPATGNEAQA